MRYQIRTYRQSVFSTPWVSIWSRYLRHDKNGWPLAEQNKDRNCGLIFHDQFFFDWDTIDAAAVYWSVSAMDFCCAICLVMTIITHGIFDNHYRYGEGEEFWDPLKCYKYHPLPGPTTAIIYLIGWFDFRSNKTENRGFHSLTACFVKMNF